MSVTPLGNQIDAFDAAVGRRNHTGVGCVDLESAPEMFCDDLGGGRPGDDSGAGQGKKIFDDLAIVTLRRWPGKDIDHFALAAESAENRAVIAAWGAPELARLLMNTLVKLLLLSPATRLSFTKRQISLMFQPRRVLPPMPARVIPSEKSRRPSPGSRNRLLSLITSRSRVKLRLGRTAAEWRPTKIASGIS